MGKINGCGWHFFAVCMQLKKLVSPGHIHDKILMLLHLMVVDDRGKASDDPLPQAEYRALFPKQENIRVITRRERYYLTYLHLNKRSLLFALVFLLAGAEVQQTVWLRLQEHPFEPVHVAPQSRRLQVLHHPPHCRHHGVTIVGQ